MTFKLQFLFGYTGSLKQMMNSTRFQEMNKDILIESFSIIVTAMDQEILSLPILQLRLTFFSVSGQITCINTTLLCCIKVSEYQITEPRGNIIRLLQDCIYFRCGNSTSRWCSRTYCLNIWLNGKQGEGVMDNAILNNLLMDLQKQATLDIPKCKWVTIRRVLCEHMNNFVVQDFSSKIFLTYFSCGVWVRAFCSNCLYTQWRKISNTSKSLIWVCRVHQAMLHVTSNT